MIESQHLKLPSFSIVYETENLSSVELENIYRSLASLSKQTIPLNQANEFLIIDGDYAPPEVIAELAEKYPWVTVKKIPGIRYYEAKMKGAELCTGEVIVYADSDCTYNEIWLANILNLFAERSGVNAVAGETVTPVRNLYELAIAIHYFFPRFTQNSEAYPSHHYFLNNVAFRRDFLLANPIPTGLPLYRSNCLLHAYYLTNLKGDRIWKHPEARALHEPPSLSFVSWRYLLRGRDRVWRDIIQPRLSQNLNPQQLSAPTDLNLSAKLKGVFSNLMKVNLANLPQIKSVVREDITRLALVPVTLPYIIWFEFLYFVGSAITYFQPDLVLDLYQRSEKKVSGSIAIQ